MIAAGGAAIVTILTVVCVGWIRFCDRGEEVEGEGLDVDEICVGGDGFGDRVDKDEGVGALSKSAAASKRFSSDSEET